MQKNDLQAEIKSLQEYRKEAEILIEKINSVTAKMKCFLTFHQIFTRHRVFL